MIQVDLITGFLGAGKTTFIKHYAKYLMEQGYSIGILENDYGAVNVDMMLLQDLQGERCDLAMVSGGCDADCHRRRFKTKLIAMGMSGYDRVLIEPSGIFDVDEFFDVLYEEPLNRWYEAGNVIAVVDAGLEEHLSGQSDFLLASQTASAGAVVLSKTQEHSAEDIAGTIAHIRRALDGVRCSQGLAGKIFDKDWADYSEEDWGGICSSGMHHASYVKMDLERESRYSTQYYLHFRMEKEALKRAIGTLMHDPSYGNIFRIKGFLRTGGDTWEEVNATKKTLSIQPANRGQEVLIVIGEDLRKEKIDTLLSSKSE